MTTEMNRTRASNADECRNALVSALKSCSLTYEQHQLLKDSAFAVLVDRIGAKRRVGLIWRSILATYSLYELGHSAWLGNTSAFWTLMSLSLLVWTGRYLLKSRYVVKCYRNYNASNDIPPAHPFDLAIELKLNHRLNYAEHQALRAGCLTEVARLLVRRHQTNIRNAITAAIGIPAGMLLLMSVLSTWGNPIPSFVIAVLAASSACLLWPILALYSAAQWRIVQSVKSATTVNGKEFVSENPAQEIDQAA